MHSGRRIVLPPEERPCSKHGNSIFTPSRPSQCLDTSPMLLPLQTSFNRTSRRPGRTTYTGPGSGTNDHLPHPRETGTAVRLLRPILIRRHEEVAAGQETATDLTETLSRFGAQCHRENFKVHLEQHLGIDLVDILAARSTAAGVMKPPGTGRQQDVRGNLQSCTAFRQVSPRFL